MTEKPDGPFRAPLAPAVLAAVFFAGCAGALLRGVATPLFSLGAPWVGTLVVNTVACLLIGVLFARRAVLPPSVFLAATAGFCGGLSTFSRLAADIAEGWRGGGGLAALAPGLASIALGLLAVALGLAAGRRGGG
ncbi:MAG: CrcB family protein [Pseudomonadota bacterium]